MSSQEKLQQTSKLKEGAKDDGGKNRLDLIPAYPLWELGRVYTFGAGKYEDNNWRKGLKWSRIFAAVMRHLWKWWSGEELDEESGLPHLSHACWGLLSLLEYSVSHPELDDRATGVLYDGTGINGPGENGSEKVSERKVVSQGKQEEGVGRQVEGGCQAFVWGTYDFCWSCGKRLNFCDCESSQVEGIGDSTGTPY